MTLQQLKNLVSSTSKYGYNTQKCGFWQKFSQASLVVSAAPFLVPVDSLKNLMQYLRSTTQLPADQRYSNCRKIEKVHSVGVALPLSQTDMTKSDNQILSTRYIVREM